MSLSSLTRASDLSEAHLTAACESSEAMEDLLARFATIAKPGAGGERIFRILGRLATACEWVDGDLRVEIAGTGPLTTTVKCLVSLGGGFREKLFGDVKLSVPFEELSAALQAAPAIAFPLTVKEGGRRLVLTAEQETRTSLPPPMVDVDPSCMYDGPPAAANPAPRIPNGVARPIPPASAAASPAATPAATPAPSPRKMTLPLAGGEPAGATPAANGKPDAKPVARPSEGAVPQAFRLGDTRVVVRKRVVPVPKKDG